MPEGVYKRVCLSRRCYVCGVESAVRNEGRVDACHKSGFGSGDSSSGCFGLSLGSDLLEGSGVEEVLDVITNGVSVSDEFCTKSQTGVVVSGGENGTDDVLSASRRVVGSVSCDLSIEGRLASIDLGDFGVGLSVGVTLGTDFSEDPVQLFDLGSISLFGLFGNVREDEIFDGLAELSDVVLRVGVVEIDVIVTGTGFTSSFGLSAVRGFLGLDVFRVFEDFLQGDSNQVALGNPSSRETVELKIIESWVVSVVLNTDGGRDSGIGHELLKSNEDSLTVVGDLIGGREGAKGDSSGELILVCGVVPSGVEDTAPAELSEGDSLDNSFRGDGELGEGTGIEDVSWLRLRVVPDLVLGGVEGKESGHTEASCLGVLSGEVPSCVSNGSLVLLAFTISPDVISLEGVLLCKTEWVLVLRSKEHAVLSLVTLPGLVVKQVFGEAVILKIG